MADFVKQGLTEIYKTTLGADADEVVIGDASKTGELVPKIEFSKWAGEEKLSIQYEGLTPVASAVVDGTLYMDTASEGFYFRKADNDIVKFGLILYELPSKDKIVTIDGVEYYQWTFKLVGWEEFDFCYQPPFNDYEEVMMTAEESPWGVLGIHHRKTSEPKRGLLTLPKVHGSYAVYHKTKRNYEVGKTNYRTGKLCHIYRPRLFDVDGNFLGWVDIEIREGVYYLRAETKLFDAKYPLKFNDELGYHITASSMYNFREGLQKVTMPSSGGTITEVVFYGRGDGTIDAKGLVYTCNASNYPETRQAVGAEISNIPASDAWRSSSMSQLVSAGDYFIGIVFNSAGYTDMYQDSYSGAYGRYDNAESDAVNYASPELTHPSGMEPDPDYMYCIYATYTPSGGGGGWVRGGKLKNII